MQVCLLYVCGGCSCILLLVNLSYLSSTWFVLYRNLAVRNPRVKNDRKSHYVVQVLQQVQTNNFMSAGHTEQVVDDKNPTFGKSVGVLTFPDQILHFRVYDSDQLHTWTDRDILGTVEVTAAQLLADSQSQSSKYPLKYSAAALALNDDLKESTSLLAINMSLLLVEHINKDPLKVTATQLREASTIRTNFFVNCQ